MSLWLAWLVGILSALVGLGIISFAMCVLIDGPLFPYLVTAVGGVAVCVAGIFWAFSSYEDAQHKGEVCVHSQEYTTYVLSGKVMVPVTGSECTAWGKVPNG